MTDLLKKIFEKLNKGKLDVEDFTGFNISFIETEIRTNKDGEEDFVPVRTYVILRFSKQETIDGKFKVTPGFSISVFDLQTEKSLGSESFFSKKDQQRLEQLLLLIHERVSNSWEDHFSRVHYITAFLNEKGGTND